MSYETMARKADKEHREYWDGFHRWQASLSAKRAIMAKHLDAAQREIEAATKPKE